MSTHSRQPARTPRAHTAARCRRRLRTALVTAVVAGSAVGLARGEEPVRRTFLTGSAFQRELHKPVTVSHDDAELRPLLRRLSDDRRVAIVLDRRIDPGTRLDAELAPISLHSALEQIAARAGASVTIVGDTVFCGPPAGTARLRTLIALREAELESVVRGIPQREFELARTGTFAWNDLDRPADLVVRAAQRAALRIEGIEHIPHDLWAAGTLAGVDVVETLSLLLIQFDLTFEWTASADGIRLVEVPTSVTIERAHAVRGISPETARDRIRKRFPDLMLQGQGRELVAVGTIEQHEVIAVIARGGDPDAAAREPAGFGPLANRRFTLRVVRKPVRAVLATLQKNEVDVRFDAEALAAAGIDLDAKISVDLEQATAGVLFDSICTPAGLEFEITGETVTLRAR